MPKMGICFRNEKGHFLQEMGEFGHLVWSENPSDAKLHTPSEAVELVNLFGHCMFIGVIRLPMRRAILIETATGFYVCDGDEVRKCRTFKGS